MSAGGADASRRLRDDGNLSNVEPSVCLPAPSVHPLSRNPSSSSFTTYVVVLCPNFTFRSDLKVYYHDVRRVMTTPLSPGTLARPRAESCILSRIHRSIWLGRCVPPRRGARGGERSHHLTMVPVILDLARPSPYIKHGKSLEQGV